MSVARTDEIVTSGDVSIVVHVDGVQGDDVLADVVVLPSYGRDGGEDFDAFASELAAAGHRVLRPQPRGIAGSTGPISDVTMEDLAADVATVIERLDAAPAVVVGHAFGNFVARVLAVNHPNLVDRVVLAAASGHTVDPVVNSAPFRAGDPTLPESERLEALALAFFAPGHDASIWLSGWYPEALATQHDAVKRLDPERYWTAGDTPILEIIAEHDPFHIRSEWNDLAREAGDRVSTVVIEGASHALFPEQPTAVAEAVLTYLDTKDTVMPHTSSPLGGRLPLADRASLNDAQGALFDRYATEAVPWARRAGFVIDDPDSGALIGPLNPSLLSPEISARFWDYQIAEERHTTLTPRERQTVILAVGAIWESGYELYAHSVAALNAGFTPEQVDSLASGQLPDGLTGREQIAWRVATALTASRRIDGPLYDQATELLGTHGLSDALHLIGAYQVVCGFLNAFDVPVPE